MPLAQPRRGRLADAFEHRSGRIIALCRAVMAAVFLFALWIDPGQPVRASTAGYALLASYLAFAAALLVVAWRNWWWEHRLARGTFVIDILAFLFAVFFTESIADDFTSPFLAFFAFLMLAATIRWDWRTTAITGLAVTTLYLVVGLTMNAAGIDIDLFRFGRRVVYMLVLALVLIWFGIQRGGQHVDRFIESGSAVDRNLPPLGAALAYAMAQAGAAKGAIAWAQEEEPHVDLRTVGLDCRETLLGPKEFVPERLATEVRMFDRARRRCLKAGRGARPEAVPGPVDEPLAALLDLDEALAVPLYGGTGRGELLLAGIPGPGSDFVEVGRLLAREIASAFDRHATAVLARESALSRIRDGLARDLHDSVAQTLAGATMRLEALRAWIREGGDPEPEIVAMKAALRSEQAQVRLLIERLRATDAAPKRAELSAEFARLSPALGDQWGVAVRCEAESSISVSAVLAHEVLQVIREAVANAVRHGGARNVTIEVASGLDHLSLNIADDGAGFLPGAPARPRSIAERVARLGGSLSVASTHQGAALTITLPHEVSR
jgi:signal transduction histidine kinase